MAKEEILSAADQEAVCQAIRQVEATSAGEVAVMILPQSDPYPEAALLAGLAGGTPLALLATDLFLADSLAWFVPLAIVAVTGIFLAAQRLDWLRRPFVAQGRREEETWQRATQSFFEHGLYRTRAGTGVLVFISLFEQKVCILVDRGLAAHLPEARLAELAAGVAAGTRRGQAAAALQAAIAALGQVLAEHFPRQPGDTDELPDLILSP
ncbi:MAG: hypothetical protein AB1634_09285 [Thermodesulfobacteriota bacterium]